MQPLFIGPINLGIQQNLKPFMIPEDAFVDMLNAYVFRGRVEKKAGYQLLGRLKRNFTAVSITNAPNATISSADPTIDLKTRLGITGATSSIASGFTITIAAPISQVLTDLVAPNPMQPATDNVNISPFNLLSGIISAVINYTTGIITLQWAGVFGGSTATFTGGYFPGLPVMGIRNREIPTAVNTEQTIFFDTVYAYQFSGGSFGELPSTLPITWSGADYQQFWSTNFQTDALNHPLFWVTNNVSGLHAYQVTQFAAAAAGPPSTVQVTTSTANNFQMGDIVSFANVTGVGAANNGKIGTVTAIGNPFTITNPATNVFTNDAATTGIVAASRLIAQNLTGDGIRIYDGFTWANFNPMVNGLNVVTGCLMIVPFKGRLVLFSTWEGNNSTPSVNYEQRARWSQNVGQGGNILDQGVGWRDDLAGRGGYSDAATNEQIISCGFVKDELIVYFERSTWKLIYTGNEISPFIWQRINSELGAESTFSASQFDNGLLAFGNVGIHTSNGSAVERIDTTIPDEVFNAHNNTDGPLRTSSIRDFFQEIVYFAYASDLDNTEGAPGKTFFPNKMIIYNYRNNTFSFFDDNATCFGPFQRVADVPWSGLTNFTWAAWNQTWNSGSLKAQFPSIAFGNQQGFVELIQSFFTSNDSSLWVQNIVGNTVTSPQHNLFEGQYVVFHNASGMTNLNDLTFQIQTVTDENIFVLDGNPAPSGTYEGNGTIEVLSEIKVLTKQFTPFWTKGNRYELKYIDILFDKTSAGEVAVDVFVDFADTNSMTDTATGVVLGAATVATAPESTNLPYYSFQQQGAQIWKRFYTVAMGETFQLQFSFNDTEMRTRAQVNADVVIHAMILHFSETGSFY